MTYKVDDLFQMVERLGAFSRDSHFVYTNGHHGREHLNWGLVLLHPDISYIAAVLLGELVEQSRFETIVGPVHTGDKVARDLFFELNKRRFGLKCAYAEEEKILRNVEINGEIKSAKVDTGRLFFPRKQDLVIAGRRCIVVDDVVTTGGTIEKTVEAVHRANGLLVATVAIYNIGTIVNEFLGVPFHCLRRAETPFWEEDACLACKEGKPVNKTINKHGRDFLAKYGYDPSGWPANKSA